jgi:hypothetical protein
LPHHDLDRVGAAEVVGVHAVARGEVLVDEELRMPALLLGHAAVAGGGGGARERGATAERLLGLRGERAEGHSRDGDRDLQVDGLRREAGAEGDLGRAAFAVAFERVAGDRRAEEEEVVEVGHAAFRAAAADVVDAGGGGAADLGVDLVREGPALPGRGAGNVGFLLGHGADQ